MHAWHPQGGPVPLKRYLLLAIVIAHSGCTRPTIDPFPEPIEASRGVLFVGIEEFASLPDVEGSSPRPMLLLDEPATGRLYVNDMWGPLYTVSYGGEVRLYLDISDPGWGIMVNAAGRERGFQSFAVHPQFAHPGTPGFGKLYTWLDVSAMEASPDFIPGGGRQSHHTVLLEWTARDPKAVEYDGGLPRELMRLEQPFSNHNGGQIAFNPLALPDDPDFGLLYVGVADGGGSGDPLDLAQDSRSIFGKILRVDPLGSNSSNGKYGIPPDNPLLESGDGTLGEIYAIGLRNPQRLGWDAANGNLLVADIGQRAVEKISLVPAGGNLGWRKWEGSFRFIGREGVDTRAPRSDLSITYPIAEFDRVDPLFQSRVAITGVVVYRSDSLPALSDRILFGEMVSGEIFHIPADNMPPGGPSAIRRVLLREGGEPSTFLGVLQRRAETLDYSTPDRADLRFGTGPHGRIFLLNKHDGIVRELVSIPPAD